MSDPWQQSCFADILLSSVAGAANCPRATTPFVVLFLQYSWYPCYSAPFVVHFLQCAPLEPLSQCTSRTLATVDTVHPWFPWPPWCNQTLCTLRTVRTFEVDVIPSWYTFVHPWIPFVFTITVDCMVYIILHSALVYTVFNKLTSFTRVIKSCTGHCAVCTGHNVAHTWWI